MRRQFVLELPHLTGGGQAYCHASVILSRVFADALASVFDMGLVKRDCLDVVTSLDVRVAGRSIRR
jgi:hypothetical protein